MTVLLWWLSMRQHAHLDRKTLPLPAQERESHATIRSIFALDESHKRIPFLGVRCMHICFPLTLRDPSICSREDQQRSKSGVRRQLCVCLAIYDIAVPWCSTDSGSLRREGLYLVSTACVTAKAQRVGERAPPRTEEVLLLHVPVQSIGSIRCRKSRHVMLHEIILRMLGCPRPKCSYPRTRACIPMTSTAVHRARSSIVSVVRRIFTLR